MSPLATEIYKTLRRHLRANHISITYGELATEVSKKIATHARSKKLHDALTELTTACRAQSLPCLPAMVWSSTTRRPSTGYYKVAHSRSRSELAAIKAWETEYDRVVSGVATFPEVLA
jgi:hypothetical protein